MLNQKLKIIWAATILSGAWLIFGLASWYIVREIDLLLYYTALAICVFPLVLLAPFFGRQIRKTFTILKSRWRAVVLVMIFVLAARLIIPCPLKGSWIGGLTGHLCEDHAFVRFSGGEAVYFHGELKPAAWGTYEKIGWNTYLWKHYPSDQSPSTIHVGWFFFSIEGKKFGNYRYRFHRDYNLVENYRTSRSPRIESKAFSNIKIGPE